MAVAGTNTELRMSIRKIRKQAQRKQHRAVMMRADRALVQKLKAFDEVALRCFCELAVQIDRVQAMIEVRAND